MNKVSYTVRVCVCYCMWEGILFAITEKLPFSCISLPYFLHEEEPMLSLFLFKSLKVCDTNQLPDSRCGHMDAQTDALSLEI